MRNQVISRWLAAGVVLALCGCSSSTAPTGSTPSESNAPGNAASSAPAPKPAPPPPVVIPAGTSLVVTMDQAVSTKTNKKGEAFASSLAEPVNMGGKEILAVGTKATGTIVESKQAGKVKGSATLALSLDSLTVRGTRYNIQSALSEESTKGRGKRTAVGAGGGAAGGAIIGAIAGGGKGAAIGALVGGAAGTAGAAFTGNRDIELPAETRLQFQLTQPLTVSQR